MYKLMTAVAAITVTTALATIAGAAPKKPTVCTAWVETTMPIDGTPTHVAVCTDRKKPVILTTYSVVTIKDEDGEPVKVVSGYR